MLNEIRLGWYSRTAYLCSKLIYSLPGAAVTFVAFALPASSMAGLHQDVSLYMAVMLVYLLSLRMAAIASAWLFKTRTAAAVFFGFLFTLVILAAGTTFHYKGVTRLLSSHCGSIMLTRCFVFACETDLSMAVRWLYFVSPTRWSHEALIGWEFSSNVSLN